MLEKLTASRVLLVATLVMLLALLRPAIEQVPDLMQAHLPNPDSFYKLVLVREYSPETGFQYMARDNAPSGTYQHWSAVHSWALLQGHRALRIMGVERDQSLLIAGSAITGFSMLALALLVARLVTNQGSLLAAIVAVIALASNVPLHGYGQLNQITHHVFMLVPVVAAAVCLMPTPAPRPGRAATGLFAGALLGLALWISPETMPMVVALLATKAAHNLHQVGNSPLTPTAAGLVGMILLAWRLDPPPPTFSPWALDHVSLAWLLFVVLLAFLLMLIDWVEKLYHRLFIRLAIPSVAAIGAGMLWIYFVPHALQGPEGLIPAELKVEWWDYIQELQPVKFPHEWVAFLAMPVCAGTLLAFVAYRDKCIGMAVLAASVFAYAALAFQHTRMGAAAGVLAAIGYGVALSRLVAFRDLQPASAHPRQQLAVSLLIFIPILQLFLVWILKHDEIEPAGSSKAEQRCRISDIAQHLNALPAGIMLTPINYGPELLWRTDHLIIAGNYHHNVEGLLDHHRLWKSTVPDESAIRLIEKRGINYILACSSAALSPASLSDRPALAERTKAGDRIAWLSAPEKMGHWWIYRTRD